MNFLVALKNSFVITLGAYAGRAVRIVCRCFRNLTSSVGKSHRICICILFSDRSCRFHAVMIPISVTCYKYQSYQFPWRNYLLDIGFFCAFGILTFTGFLKSYLGSWKKQPPIDGCGVFRIMTQIVFPLVKPATVTIGVLFFMWSWNDFLLPSILIGDSELRPLTVNLFMFRSATSTQWNLFIAGLTLCIIPTIILYICAQKYITSGLTMGAVK